MKFIEISVTIINAESFEDAIDFASATAAISVTRESAQPSVLTRIEIDSFLIESIK